MTRTRTASLVVLTCAVALLLVSSHLPAIAQAKAQDTAEEPEAPSAAKVESSVIEYMRDSYRDPFRSLREPKVEDEGPRPEGPPGMLIEEIDLVGVLSGPRGAMALIIGSDGLGYSLTEGSPLYDGVVLRINPDEGLVVFRQNVNDPNRIKPYRDIERRLDSGS